MRSNGKKNVTPLRAPYSKRVRRFAPLKVGERNKVNGTMGAELRASTSRKKSSATTPIASAPGTSGVPKPSEPASISPYTSAPNPSVTVPVPHQSSLPDASVSRLSGTRQNRTPSTTAASGTLRKKTQRQAGVLHQHAPEHRTHHGGERGKPRPGANGSPALLGACGGADNGQAAWDQHGCPDTLHGSRDDQ